MYGRSVQRDFHINYVAKKCNFLSVECYLYTSGSRIYWLFLYKFVYVVNSGVDSIHHTIGCNPSVATTIISSRACHRYICLHTYFKPSGFSSMIMIHFDLCVFDDF